jgi:hypothetical protein
MTSPEDYLWDRSGEPDPEVAALEKLLAPLAHDPARTLRPPRARAARGALALVAVGALGAVAATAFFLLRGPEEMPLVTPDGQHLAAGSVVEREERCQLALGDQLGTITLEPRSRFRVERLARDEARFALDHGQLTALVGYKAKPRFFKVETPASTCVDLGCRYTLQVDDEGNAHVHVLTGAVSFEDRGREVYVPKGATCHSYKGLGAGIPRFEDAKTPPALLAALDAFDRERNAEQRRKLAGCALDAMVKCVFQQEEHRDTLSAWHLLQDEDESIAHAASDALERVDPAANPACGAWHMPSLGERQVWRERLAKYWY